MEETTESSLTMRGVWVIGDAIISPLGKTSRENFTRIQNGESGVGIVNDPLLSPVPVAVSRIRGLERSETFTRFERMCMKAIQAITDGLRLPPDRTLFILSTTKGNIAMLDGEGSLRSRVDLPSTLEHLAAAAGFRHHMLVSNACISGVMALTVAKRYLQAGEFDHALVLGADELSRFVVSGFQSLQALSDAGCRPFDASRNGINLGEAAAALLLSAKPDALGAEPVVKILGSGLSNDANHISGPSRTGEELAMAIRQATGEAMIAPREIDFISAHGTATLYNDEMEAKAFHLAGLHTTPLHSLKGYYGHTLGAAGVLETIIGVHGLINNVLIATQGFNVAGVSQPVNVIRETAGKPVRTFLKTASGFGGCNAAIVLQKTTT